MVTPEEQQFMTWWEENRLRKKKIRRQLSVGLPLGVAFAAAILVNVYSEWNPAGSFLKHNGQRMVVLLIAVLLIVIFIVIFSAWHKWDMNEQQYKELLGKKDKS